MLIKPSDKDKLCLEMARSGLREQLVPGEDVSPGERGREDGVSCWHRLVVRRAPEQVSCFSIYFDGVFCPYYVLSLFVNSRQHVVLVGW